MAGKLEDVVRQGTQRFRNRKNELRRYEALSPGAKLVTDLGDMLYPEKDKNFKNKYLPSVEKYTGYVPRDDVRGFVYPPRKDPAQNTIYQRDTLSYTLNPNDRIGNENHEVSHLLDHRNSGGINHPLEFNRSLGISNEDFMGFWKGLSDTLEANKDSLRRSYMSTADSDYMDRPKKAPFAELMALMNQIEDTYNVDLTKDRRFAEFFANPLYKEMYNSATGYRRTRMDAKDLKPYTPRK